MLAAVLVLMCGAGGFAAYRVLSPPSTLRVAPTGPEGKSPAPLPPSARDSAARTIPESLPDLALPDVAGTLHRLTEWKGHALMVNFWATWCDPCRREIPLLKGLRNQRRGNGLEIVGIAVDFRDTVEKYVEVNRIEYPILIGEQGGYAAVAAFGMDAVLPFTAFADSSGRIVTLKVGELHRDEADFILDRLQELEDGRIELAAAREQIAAGIRLLAAHRAGTDAAAH